ncbi:MAG TPA: hypothetical protein VIL08_02470 [Limnochorda sp.]
MADSSKEIYERIGRQMAEALTLFLGALASQVQGQAVGGGPGDLESLRAHVQALEERLKRLEDRLAGQPVEGVSEEGQAQPAQGAATASESRRSRRGPGKARKARRRRRMPKEEVRARALEAGRLLAAQGKTVNLTTVANAAGLNYGQVTYAFERKENLLRELGLLEPEAES